MIAPATINGVAIPPGYIRLRSEAPGMQAMFLAATNMNNDYTSTVNGVNTPIKGRGLQLVTYVDDPKVSLFKWTLRTDKRTCRTLLVNLSNNAQMGLIRQGGPLTSGFSMPVAATMDGATQGTDETWEVEFVRQGAANAATAAAAVPVAAPIPVVAPAPVVAAAPAPVVAPAPVPAPIVAPVPAPVVAPAPVAAPTTEDDDDFVIDF